MSLRILELFSGSAIFSQVARERGHEARTLDFNPRYGADYCVDIRHWWWEGYLGDWRPDVIWASPDCTRFSLANGPRLRTDWGPPNPRAFPYRGGPEPLTKEAKDAWDMAWWNMRIIEAIAPKRWFVENPVGLLRQMPFMPRQRKTITYCSYGAPNQKPTDIWTNSSWVWEARSRCTKKARNCGHADRNDPRSIRNSGHAAWDAPGSIQSMGSEAKHRRAMLPRALCEEIIQHLEVELAAEDIANRAR